MAVRAALLTALAGIASLALAPAATAAPFTGAELVRQVGDGSRHSGVTDTATMNGKLFYLESDNASLDLTLLGSDGSQAGTAAVKTLASPVDGTPYFDGQVINAGGRLFILAQDLNDGSNSTGTGWWDLWTSDGTAAGTRVVATRFVGDQGLPAMLTALGGRIFFTMFTEANGTELWTSDGTEAGTGMVKDIVPGPTNSVSDASDQRLVAGDDGLLYFLAFPTEADELEGGAALWRTDGTEAGTDQLTDPADGIGADHDSLLYSGPVQLGGEIYFSRSVLEACQPTCDDPVVELWRYTPGNGTSGVALTADPEGFATASTERLWADAGRIFLSLATSKPFAEVRYELWQFDGTSGSLVSEIPDFTFPDATADLGGASVFPAGDGGLWRSDGSAAGTFRLGDVEVNPGRNAPLHELEGWITELGGGAYFEGEDPEARDPDGNSVGYELWYTDGTVAGTVPAVRFPDAGGDPSLFWLTDLGGQLLFTAEPVWYEDSHGLLKANHSGEVSVDQAGGGGDTGGGNAGGADSNPPKGTAKVKGRPKAGKTIKIRVRSDEPASILGKGRVTATKRRGSSRSTAVAAAKGRKEGGKAFELKRDREEVDGGEKVTLKLKFKGKKKARKLRRAVKRKGLKAKAKIQVRFEDEAGNRSTEKLKVRLR